VDECLFVGEWMFVYCCLGDVESDCSTLCDLVNDVKLRLFDFLEMLLKEF